jgi:hypothetical protein
VSLELFVLVLFQYYRGVRFEQLLYSLDRDYPGFSLDQIEMVAQDLLKFDDVINYWTKMGCLVLTDGELEIVRPAPTAAVVSFLYGPPDPRFLPYVPPEYAQLPLGSVEEGLANTMGTGRATGLPHGLPPVADQPRAAESRDIAEGPPDDAGLRSSLALDIATYMIEMKQQRLHYLLPGLSPSPQERATALIVLAFLVQHRKQVLEWSRNGMNVSGEWVRPAPARLIAERLGIGP